MSHNVKGRGTTGRVISPDLCGALTCVMAIVFTCPGLLHAQTVPNAGSVLHQIEGKRQKSLPPPSAPQFLPPPPMKSLGGATVVVKSFRFAGNKLLTDKRLAAAVAGFLNRRLDFTQLQNATVAVASAYRKAGWVVRVYLPRQDVTTGTVTIQIVEAVFGAVHVEGRSRRVSADRIARMIDAAQPPGAPVNADALDRALLLINDLPGVSATGRLSAGLQPAETDLNISAADGPLVTGLISADNYGERFTGAAQLTTEASLNSPFGFGDRADGLWLHSQGSDYERAAYSLPLGVGGWRLGVNGAHLNYRIVTADFAALDAHGSSTTAGIDASYPLLRAPLKNVYIDLTAGDKLFDNQSAGFTTGHYSIRTGSAGLYGNVFDTLGGGGSNSFSLTYEQGMLDLAGSANEAADALTTDTAGSFGKLSLSASRLQRITRRWSLYAGVSAQGATKNLDSSERFYLGGASGVRAYPTNEGGGSEGLLADLEARVSLPAGFNASGFFDWGEVRINKDDNFLGAARPNTDRLRGAGLSVGWVAPFGFNVRVTAARRIGRNPEPTATGADQGGSLVMNRVWLQASMPF